MEKPLLATLAFQEGTRDNEELASAFRVGRLMQRWENPSPSVPTVLGSVVKFPMVRTLFCAVF